ncbi:hypothetical protein PIB30_061238 [Stylosanthes scabra]|uniref:Secreted protein n=1 Tax=Stylosanthes scabra TaxID=79078 RepID=A0ABU6UJL7_9FABA|nr:hypothetical protein [Stylosanthes scabra]
MTLIWLLLGFVVCLRQPSGGVVRVEDVDRVVEIEGPIQQSLLAVPWARLRVSHLRRLTGDHRVSHRWTLMSPRLICLETFPSRLVVLHRQHSGICPRLSRTMTRLSIRTPSLAEVAESLGRRGCGTGDIRRLC